MKKLLTILSCLAVAAVAAPGAEAQGTVKIGVIMSYSGQFADTATQIDNGIKLYMKQKGDTVAGKKIEIIRKDTGGIAPDVATRLAQELVTRDNVDILAGFALSPNAIAVSKVSAEAKKFMVIMNAATTVIITMSPYSVRTSVTLPSIGMTAGAWAYKSGVRKAYTMVSDFAPGKDAEAAFHEAFKKAGGEIVGSVRMAVANPDFSAYRAEGQGRQSGIDLHLRPRRRAAGGHRQGLRRARHRCQEGQDHRRPARWWTKPR